MQYEGSCHCGQVAYTVEGDFTEGMECNCSHCRRKGFLLAFVPRDKLTLMTPASDYETYLFNEHMIAHHFCPTCGVEPFADSQMPDGSKMAAINLRCISDLDLSKLTIKHFDGASK